MKLLHMAIGVLVSMGFCSASVQAFTAAERTDTIDRVVDQLVHRYVDPTLGQKAARTIRQKKAKHAYDAMDTLASLIEALMADMHAATSDKQLQLKNRSEADSDWIHPVLTIKTPDGTAMDDQYKQMILQMINYGLPAQVQDGHIGCLCILEFYSPEIVPKVRQVIDKTMQSFQECTAMILDVRQCSRGGDPEVMMYLASYFLGGEASEPLYVSFDRENQRIAEFRTCSDIAGKRMLNIPLYVLVSAETFATGEMFAYGLQKMGRAKIVGDTSAGATYVTQSIDIGHGMMMVLPVNRLAHAKTETDWQGTGVMPDVSTPADKALEVAKDLIRKK